LKADIVLIQHFRQFFTPPEGAVDSLTNHLNER